MEKYNNNASIYGYNPVIYIILTPVIIFLAFINIEIFRFYLNTKHVFVIVIFPVIFLSLILMFRAILSRMSLYLDKTSITTSIFGLKIKKIKWTDVQKIRKMRIYNGYNYVDSFQIYGVDHGVICRFFVNICGSIHFTQDIGSHRELLEEINLIAEQYKIPLVVLDTQAAVARFSQDTAPGRWGRGAARNGEVKVAKF